MESCVRTKEIKEFEKYICGCFDYFEVIERSTYNCVNYRNYYELMSDQNFEGTDEDVFKKYYNTYNSLHTFVLRIQKDKQCIQEKVKELNSIQSFINKITNERNPKKIIDRLQETTFKSIVKLNEVVEKMIQKKDDIFNKQEELIKQENDSTKRSCEYETDFAKRKQQHEEEKQKLLQMRFDDYKALTQFPYDNEMQHIEKSMIDLQNWSGKQNSTIIFDSVLDGDGLCNLDRKVTHDCYQYFIVFDTDNNIFGGYLAHGFFSPDNWINDSNAFLFSLVRNGKTKIKRYPRKPGYSAFKLYRSNHRNGWLFKFSYDLVVKPVGNKGSYCYCNCYDYDNEQYPLINNMDNKHHENFEAKRIIVIQMN
ncbi:hypothetical protein QTN25_007830 [Entamoeba marina]